MIIPNWIERITLAKRRKGFTNIDREAAGSWRSCAVSENPKIAVRFSLSDPFSGPYNPRARKLGMQFLEAVKKNYYFKAEKLLKQIKRLRT